MLSGPEIPSKPHLGFGNRVALQHPNGLVTIYAHLHAIDPAIQPGVEVADGAPIGKSGNTGESHGPHLHFEVRIGAAAPTQPSIDPYGYRGSGVLWKSAAVHDCTCPAECAAGSGGVQLVNDHERDLQRQWPPGVESCFVKYWSSSEPASNLTRPEIGAAARRDGGRSERDRFP